MASPTREQVHLAVTAAYIARHDAEGYAALTNDDIAAVVDAVMALIDTPATEATDAG